MQSIFERVRERLRGARRLELYALAVALALLGLIVLRGKPAGQTAVQRTALEVRLERVLSRIDGAGAVSAMVNEDVDGTVTGAVIVAEDLSDIQVYLQLQRAVRAVLDIDISRITIIGGGAFGGMG